jgi:asparagine synthase (glutamine-hydrolysing)
MCGIAGYWSSGGLDDDPEKNLSQMINTLHHRGPDGRSLYIDSKNRIAMGHTRLSIIDLETGEQPLVSRRNNLVLTVNGEFYDYKRIRAELVLEGSEFRTKSDSEIVFDLYNKFGLDFVEHLRGEFAICLFDIDRQRLVIVRDRFGIKPLFYHLSKDVFYYGSEVKALFAHPDVPRGFSPQGLVHQLMHTMVPGTTAYKDIHAVKPGHMLIIDKGSSGFKIREKCYWDMNFPYKDERSGVKEEQHYIESVREKLVESVHLRLEADVPVGCYLSGGIDSCSILGLAGSLQQSPVKAFTISFDHEDYDESHIAKVMAESVKADHEILYLKAEDLYGQNYVNTLWHAERTFYNTLGVAKYCMSKRVNECGYKVVITGEGSDELFGGYPAFKKDMYYHGMDSSLHDIETM